MLATFRRVLLLVVGGALLPLSAAAQVPRPTSLAAEAQVPRPTNDPTGTPPSQPTTAAPEQTQPDSSQGSSSDTRFDVFQRQIRRALERKDIAEAVAIAERQYVYFPDEMKASADLGGLYFRQGYHEKAEPILRTALNQQSVAFSGDLAAILSEVSFQLGQIELDAHRPKAAIPFLERSIDRLATVGLPRFLLAIALYQTGDTERAERVNAQAFDLDRIGARALNYVLYARSQRLAGTPDDAAATVEAGLAKFPNELDLRFELALARRAQNRSAEALYELLYARALRSPNLPSKMNFDDEIKALRQEANIADADAELKAAVTYLDAAETDHPDEALASIQDAVRLSTRRSYGLQLLVVQAYMATGRFTQAERLLIQLADQQPTSVPTLALLAELYLAQSRTNSADLVIARATRIDNSNPHLREVIARRGNN
jgi:tetratricopeptide (TPR) repeat protein